MKIQDSNDLLSYLISQASERKDWFGFTQQRITAIALAHEIARNHADTLTPEQAVEYAKALNEAVYQKIIRAGN
jgi:two-component sensor histidine kinase